MNLGRRVQTNRYYPFSHRESGAGVNLKKERRPMKPLRIVSTRMMNAATPLILGAGRAGRVITGYYPRTSDGKRKPKPAESQLRARG